MTDIAVVTPEDACDRLGPYARAFEALATINSHPSAGNGGWKQSELFALVEETTTCPEPWALDSFAVLLLMCPNAARLVIGQRLKYNHIDETAGIMCALKTVGQTLH
jgi:hypothetical protein